MGFLKKITRAAVAPVRAAVNVTTSVAKGDISGAAKAAVGGITSLAPTAQINSITGGKLTQVMRSVPIVGSSTSKFLGSQSQLATGEFSGSDARTYLREGTKLAAIAYGGAVLPGALGISKGAALVGASALSKGNLGGAASSFAGESDFGGLLPEGFGEAFEPYKDFADSFMPTGGGGSSRTEAAKSAIMNSTPIRAPAAKSTFPVVPVAIAAGAVLLFILSRRK